MGRTRSVSGAEFFGRYGRVHMVGIGGAGMEGLARILVQLGCVVSGSDRDDSAVLEGLRREGVTASCGHAAANVHGADLVIYSAAIPEGNDERVEAGRLGLESMGRARAVGRLLQGVAAIAVAGTHGKTTSASMLASVLTAADIDPCVLVGGAIAGKVQARIGAGRFFVTEADEFDRSFLQIEPEVALVNNVEAEHLDTYEDAESLHAAFGQFLSSTRRQAIVNGDDPGVELSMASTTSTVNTLRFGFRDHNDYRAEAIELHGSGATFVLRRDGRSLGTIVLNVPGLHNVMNATGVAATADSLDVPLEAIHRGLSQFRGVDRRLQIKGEVGGVLVMDDYAHHPTEVRAALDSVARLGRRVITVFQPHLYSRTRDFHEAFAQALRSSDKVLLAPVYGSRERPSDGLDSQAIEASLRASGFTAVELVPERDRLLRRMSEVCESGDLLLTMGAGDIGSLADDFMTAGRSS